MTYNFFCEILCFVCGNGQLDSGIPEPFQRGENAGRDIIKEYERQPENVNVQIEL